MYTKARSSGWSLHGLWWCVIWVSILAVIPVNYLTRHRRYDTGTISGIIAMDFWKKEFSTQADGSITAAEDSLIVSILSAVSVKTVSLRLFSDLII